MGCIKWNIQYSVEYPLRFKWSSCTFAMGHEPLCLLFWSRVINPYKSKPQQDPSSWKKGGIKFLPDILNILCLYAINFSELAGCSLCQGKSDLHTSYQCLCRDQPLIWTFASFVSIVHVRGNDFVQLHWWAVIWGEFSLQAPWATRCTETRMWLVFGSAC